MIFSAVALMAFSFAGMANTSENLELKGIEVIKELPCFTQYKKDKAALTQVFSENTAEAIANADFEECLERTYPAE